MLQENISSYQAKLACDQERCNATKVGKQVVRKKRV